MIALIDNHDSFTYNLIYLFKPLGQEVWSFYPENINWQFLDQASHIIPSPSPRHPKDAPINHEVIFKYYQSKPILGVYLGHQCIADAFGGEVIKGQSTIATKFSQNPKFLFSTHCHLESLL